MDFFVFIKIIFKISPTLFKVFGYPFVNILPTYLSISAMGWRIRRIQMFIENKHQ